MVAEGASGTPEPGSELRETLRQGDPVRFDPPPTEGAEPADARAQRTIPATLLQELVDRKSGKIEQPVAIAHAVIDGPLDLTHVSIERPFAITNSEFTGPVDGAFAAFAHGLRLDGSHFSQAVSFRGVDITGDFSIQNVVFDMEVILDDLHVSLVLEASGATTFTGGIQARRLVVDRDVSFTGATFGHDAHFNNGRIGGVARFDGARFEQLADFLEMQVEGSVYFAHPDGQPATFKGVAEFGDARLGLSNFTGVQFTKEVRFGGVQFTGQANFSGAQFNDAAHFYLVRFGTDCLFVPDGLGQPVRFAQLADFSYTRITGHTEFNGAQFGGETTFHGATFGGVLHVYPDDQGQPVRFAQTANFSFAKISGVADFTDAQFGNQARFSGVQFTEEANFRGARFDGEANFNRAIFSGDCFFYPDDLGQPVRFAQLADFSFAKISGQAFFRGAQFDGRAHFDRAIFSGGCFFYPYGQGQPVRFAQLADFSFAKISGIADFTDAQFGNQARFSGVQFTEEANFRGARFDGEANFNRAIFSGGCFFYPDDLGQPVRFAQLADFSFAKISGVADFTGAQFDDQANFIRATFGSDCAFTYAQGQPVRFAQTADFSYTQVSGIADFTGAQFDSKADFEGAQFAADVRFPGAVFTQGAEFNGVDAVHDLDFEGTSFLKSTTFRDARFGDVDFAGVVLPVPRRRRLPMAPAQTRIGHHANGSAEEPGAKPPESGTVDLTGMTYARMHGDWQGLFDRLDPYDRQPYTQLEATLRQAGEDHAADDVYYARRMREFRNLLERHSRWDVLRVPVDALYRLLAGYGVRPLRFVLWILLALAVGTWVFLQPGAATYSDAKKQEALGGQPLQLDGLRAFEVSLDQLLPISIPGGSRFAPSDQVWMDLGRWESYFADYATIQTIIGWLLISALFNIVVGALRRQA